MDKFTRSENAKRYRQLLERVTDNEQRSRLKKLLAEEEQQQIEAGDFESKQNRRPAMPPQLAAYKIFRRFINTSALAASEGGPIVVVVITLRIARLHWMF